MGLLQRLEIRQGQSLVMTPQLLQAIKLLQLSHLDLAAYVEAELERNPLLERPEPEPDIVEAAHPEDAERDAGSDNAGWLADDNDPRRSELEREPAGGLDNVFSDENPVLARNAGDPGDTAPLIASPWSGGGGASDFDGDGPDFQATLASEVGLAEHLERQLCLATADVADRLIGADLINGIDEAGYFTDTVEAVAERVGASPERVETLLRLIQTFDPPGIGARTLAECLAIQLRERDRFDPAMQSLVAHLDLVAKRDLPALRRLCRVDEEDLADMLAEIRQLEPKPGRAFGAAPVEVLVPDVTVRRAPDGSWIIELNPDTLPRVLVNQTYYARVSKTAR